MSTSLEIVVSFKDMTGLFGVQSVVAHEASCVVTTCAMERQPCLFGVSILVLESQSNATHVDLSHTQLTRWALHRIRLGRIADLDDQLTIIKGFF